MSGWETVVGLEVHVRLATATKLFCACRNAFGEPPNTTVCPVCLGLPGALPVTNRAAVRLGLRAAIALDGTVHTESVFARKNYFYPDLPKGYQVSQYDRPFATGGGLAIVSPERGAVRIGLTRIHLEEDAGKLIHDRFPDASAVDLNRAGVPLAEIVTEPDLRSGPEARAWLETLKQVLQYLEVSDCDMEKGHLRVDANVSVRRMGEPELGVRQEIKNMNSFAALERAITRLRDEQVAARERGKQVHAATFSGATGELRRLRSKETSSDYRYLPEPDLPPLRIPDAWVADERDRLPELPGPRCARFRETYGLRPEQAGVLTATATLADYFEQAVAAGEGTDPVAIANWVTGPILHDVGEHGGRFRVPPGRVAELVALLEAGTLNRQAARRVLVAIAGDDDDPARVAERLGLVQVADDDRLGDWVDAAVAAHPEEAARYREGETRLLGFFMGEVMKRSGGAADPHAVRDLLRRRLA